MQLDTLNSFVVSFRGYSRDYVILAVAVPQQWNSSELARQSCALG